MRFPLTCLFPFSGVIAPAESTIRLKFCVKNLLTDADLKHTGGVNSFFPVCDAFEVEFVHREQEQLCSHMHFKTAG